jgi:hypothetical protein
MWSNTACGNSAFNGTINAPEADYSEGGGGNNTYDYAAPWSNSVTPHGHANFHYDESLGTTGPGCGYMPLSWTEVGAQ